MTIRPFRDEPNVWEHTGFILAEDEALKAYLTGIQVPGRDATSPKTDLGIWFRWPEGERQIKYPFITLDLLQAEPAFDLFTSDYYQNTVSLYRPSVAPTLPPPPEGWAVQSYAIRNFLPFRLMYQVSVHSRNALHDRYLQSIFKADVFPPRPFWVWCATDETWRRTELTQAVASDLSETTESGTKRIFRKVYTISMLAEIPQDRIVDSYVYQALRVRIPVVDLERFDQYYQACMQNVADILAIPQAEREAQGEYTFVSHDVPV
jgi:hypothetical protein